MLILRIAQELHVEHQHRVRAESLRRHGYRDCERRPARPRHWANR